MYAGRLERLKVVRGPAQTEPFCTVASDAPAVSPDPDPLWFRLPELHGKEFVTLQELLNERFTRPELARAETPLDMFSKDQQNEWCRYRQTEKDLWLKRWSVASTARRQGVGTRGTRKIVQQEPYYAIYKVPQINNIVRPSPFSPAASGVPVTVRGAAAASPKASSSAANPKPPAAAAGPLVINIARYDRDRRKNLTPVEVPLVLELPREYFSSQSEAPQPSSRPWRYLLRSLAYHVGGDSLDGGHWMAFARIGPAPARASDLVWFWFSDMEIKRCSSAAAFKTKTLRGADVRAGVALAVYEEVSGSFEDDIPATPPGLRGAFEFDAQYENDPAIPFEQQRNPTLPMEIGNWRVEKGKTIEEGEPAVEVEGNSQEVPPQFPEVPPSGGGGGGGANRAEGAGRARAAGRRSATAVGGPRKGNARAGLSAAAVTPSKPPNVGGDGKTTGAEPDAKATTSCS